MLRVRTFSLLTVVGAIVLAASHNASADGAPQAQSRAAAPALAAPAAAPSAAQRSGIFLKFESTPIAGESTDPKHKGWIELLSFSWGTAQTAVPSAVGAAGAYASLAASGRAPRSLDIKKAADKASPALEKAAVLGTQLKTVVLEIVHPTKHELYQVTMSDVVVSSFSITPAVGDRPNESMTLTFAKMEVKYQPAKPDGTLDTLRPVPAGWDVKTNTKV
jgi:type VI secretion system secreted protein Hcp